MLRRVFNGVSANCLAEMSEKEMFALSALRRGALSSNFDGFGRRSYCQPHILLYRLTSFQR